MGTTIDPVTGDTVFIPDTPQSAAPMQGQSVDGWVSDPSTGDLVFPGAQNGPDGQASEPGWLRTADD